MCFFACFPISSSSTRLPRVEFQLDIAGGLGLMGSSSICCRFLSNGLAGRLNKSCRTQPLRPGGGEGAPGPFFPGSLAAISLPPLSDLPTAPHNSTAPAPPGSPPPQDLPLSPPSPITGVLTWALLGFYPEEEAHGERRGLCRWGGGRRVRGAGWGP